MVLKTQSYRLMFLNNGDNAPQGSVEWCLGAMNLIRAIGER